MTFRRPRGIALLSVLFALTGVMAAAAVLFFTLFLDAQAASNGTAADDALYVAEAGVHHLWSTLGRAPSFDEALGWAQGTPPFGSPVPFPLPPRTYTVSVRPGPDAALVVLSEGTSHRGARSRVEAWFRRRRTFHPPAALTLAEDVGTVSVLGSAAIDAGEVAPVPAVGAETEAAGRIARSGGLPEIRLVGGSGFRDVLDPLRASADRTLAAPSDPAIGSAEAPLVVRVVSDARVTGALETYGILLADAPLRVTGSLTVHGLLLAAAGVLVEGSLTVEGAAWVTTSLELAPAGSLRVEAHLDSLSDADSLRPALLPRDAVLGGWRELW